MIDRKLELILGAIVMTTNEAFEKAITLLNQRGELLNVDLYDLVGQDKELFRGLRKSLIEQGFAEDLSGTRLKATKRVPQKRSSTPAISNTQPDEAQRPDNGPMSVSSEEQVDLGPPISFSEADFLPLSSEKPKVTFPPAPVSEISPEIQEPEASPVLVSLDVVADGRQFVSQLIERKLILSALVLVVIILAVTYIPWGYSPDARSVYQEFNQYYNQAKELRPRAASDPGEWQRAMSQPRSRVRKIVTALKDVRTGASAQQPEKQELLWAGTEGLLKLLESPEITKNEEARLQAKFESHMSEARWLLDGGTRSVPAKQDAPTESPGAGKGYLGK